MLGVQPVSGPLALVPSSSGEPGAKALEVLAAPFLAGPRMPLGTRQRKAAPALEGARSQPSSAEKPKAKRRSSRSSADAGRPDEPPPASAAAATARADEDEQEAEVDCIVDHRRTEEGQAQFRVRWKGHGATEDTWEPYRNLQNCRAGSPRAAAELLRPPARRAHDVGRSPSARTDGTGVIYRCLRGVRCARTPLPSPNPLRRNMHFATTFTLL